MVSLRIKINNGLHLFLDFQYFIKHLINTLIYIYIYTFTHVYLTHNRKNDLKCELLIP